MAAPTPMPPRNRKDHEFRRVGGQGGSERAKDVEDADHEEHLLAAVPVCRLAGDQGAEDGADERDRRR